MGLVVFDLRSQEKSISVILCSTKYFNTSIERSIDKLNKNNHVTLA